MKALQRTPQIKPPEKKGGLFYFKRDWLLYAMLVLPVAWYIVFCYIPMYGVTIAFRDYNIFKGIMASEWVGFKYFNKILHQAEFYRVIKNTLVLNTLDLILGFPLPIILAILLSELKSIRFCKISQTILYLPHFISMVIISGLVFQIFAPESGIINVLRKRAGSEPIPFLSDPTLWTCVYLFVGLWQGTGWGSIIYMAAIAGINPELYEAAAIDGAGRLRKIWHITLPGISSTIVILLIMRMGSMVSIGFEKPYLLGNTYVKEASDVISTYVYRMGLESSNYEIATAVGLMQSAIGMVLLLLSNAIANSVNGSGIF